MPSESKKPSASTLKRGVQATIRHVTPFKRRVLLLAGLGVISAIANGTVPYVTGRFFDALIALSQGEVSEAGMAPWLLFLLIWAGVQVVANNIDWIIDRLRRAIDINLHLAVQTSGFVHLLKLPLSFHKSARINEAIERISKASWRMSGVVRTLMDLAPQLLGILIGISLAASIHTGMAGILLLGVVVYLVLLVRILKPIAALDDNAHRAWNEGWNDAAAAVHQVETVKQAAAEEFETKRAQGALMGKAYGLWEKLEYIWSNVNFFQRFIVFLTQLAVFVGSVQLISSGAISVGELVALNGYALMFFGPFVTLGHSWQTIQNGLTAAAHAEEIFQEREELYRPADPTPLPLPITSISFKDVTFRYEPSHPAILTNLSFEVEQGDVVALVGASGVGKSTTISLISGYHFPTEGSVRIGGVDTRKLDLMELRHAIAVVPQEVALFNESIRHNIRYGTFDATDAQVEQAVRQAHLEEFIAGLPQGYDTLVGERGVKLSVGQKQRVAIARAIIRNPQILILDEPTSALDAKTEKHITDSLEELMKGRTTFIIAHRLSTVRRADKILVFDKGTIVEAGKHDELVKKDRGLYRSLYEHQVGLHT